MGSDEVTVQSVLDKIRLARKEADDPGWSVDQETYTCMVLEYGNRLVRIAEAAEALARHLGARRSELGTYGCDLLAEVETQLDTLKEKR